jgi:hypothetical protein
MQLDTEKLANRALVLLIAYTAFSGVCRAALKPFWCDEVITVGLARLPTLGTIWDALGHSADSHPPTFHILERVAGRLPFNELIAFRLPSILAFCGVVLCVFLFIKKRRGSACALICAAIPLLSLLFSPYAVEARGYSLMAGFVALAMVCYQRADKAAWWVLMGLSLAAAEGSHYYAVFATLLFGLAELALLAKERRVRFGVWLALLFGTLPLVVFWPLLAGFKRYYGGSPISGRLQWLDEAARAYGWLFNLPPTLGIGLAATALAAVLIYVLVSQRASLATSLEETPLQEQVLTLGFLVLPLLMYVAIRLVHGGFNSRYLLLAVLSFPLSVSYVLPALDRRLLGLFSILLFVSLGAQEAVFWRWQLHSLGKNTSPAEGVERLVRAAGYGDLPVVESDPVDYLSLAYYASPAGRRRFVYVADVPAAIVYAGSGTADKCLLVLRPYLGLQVDDFAAFAGDHPEFLLYSDGRPIWDWWPTRLLHDGYALELVAMDQGSRIYLVGRKR